MSKPSTRVGDLPLPPQAPMTGGGSVPRVPLCQDTSSQTSPHPRKHQYRSIKPRLTHVGGEWGLLCQDVPDAHPDAHTRVQTLFWGMVCHGLSLARPAPPTLLGQDHTATLQCGSGPVCPAHCQDRDTQAVPSVGPSTWGHPAPPTHHQGRETHPQSHKTLQETEPKGGITLSGTWHSPAPAPPGHFRA